MKVVTNRFIPFGKGFAAINLFGVIFTKTNLDKTLLNHEGIHTAQMKELAYVFFYLLYVLEWLLRLMQYGLSKKAYFNISFEREAYANMHDSGYIRKRPRFAFCKYIRNKT